MKDSQELEMIQLLGTSRQNLDEFDLHENDFSILDDKRLYSPDREKPD